MKSRGNIVKAIEKRKKKIDLEEVRNVKQMWEQMKQAMVESAREVCGSVRKWGEKTQRVCGGMMR